MPLLLNHLAQHAPITFAPTGMVPTRAKNPNVPLQPEEIVREVREAVRVGISTVHLHARDDHDDPTWDREIYRRIILEIRSHSPELVINVSTSGRNWSEFEKRIDVLELEGDAKPDVASLTTSSLNFIGGPSVNSPEMIRMLARAMLDRGIIPEIEAFDLGMLNFAKVLRREGLVPDGAPVTLMFGNVAGFQPTLAEFAAALATLPTGSLWSGAGIGDFQLSALALSIASGGGFRVGLEDVSHLDRGHTTLATNDALLRRVHQMLEFCERRMMSSNEYRERIGIR